LAFENLKPTPTNFVELHNAWQTVLDTKTLNKQFYKELSQWYFWAMKEVYFPNTEGGVPSSVCNLSITKFMTINE
jgi:hypothetical protein